MLNGLALGPLRSVRYGALVPALVIPGATIVHWFRGEDAVDDAGDLDAWVSRAVTPVSVAITGTPTVEGTGADRYVLTAASGDLLDIDALVSLAAGDDTAWFAALAVQPADVTGTEVFLSFDHSSVSNRYLTIGHINGKVLLTARRSTTTAFGNGLPSVSTAAIHRMIVARNGTDFRLWFDGLPAYLNGIMTADLDSMDLDQASIGGSRKAGSAAEYAQAAYHHVALGNVGTLSSATRRSLLTAMGGTDPFAAVAGAVGTKETILIIGQSNASGLPATETAWPDDTTVPSLQVIDLGTHYGGALARKANGDHGCEFGFVEAEKAAGYAPAALKRAYSGTGLAAGSSTNVWDPGTADDIYDRTLNWFNASALPLMGELGWPTTVAAVLWLQGETDCEDETNADAYGANLAALSAALRTDLSAASLPVVAMLLHVDLDKPYVDNARASIVAWQAADPVKNLLVVVDDLTLFDDVHLDGADLDEFGARASDALRFGGIAHWTAANYLSGNWEAYRGGDKPLTEATNPPAVGAVGSLPTVDFDGSSDLLSYHALAASYTGVDLGVSFAFQFDAVAANAILISFFASTGGGTAAQLEIRVSGTDKIRVNYREGGGSLQTNDSAQAFAADGPHVLDVDITAAGVLTVHYDGVDVSPAGDITVTAGLTTIDRFSVGARYTAANPADIQVFGARFTRALSGAALTARRQIVADMAGIAL